MKRRVGGLVSFLAAGLLLMGAAPHSVLHLHLEKSDPAKDAALAASPEAVHLWYSEAPELKLTTVKVTGADGKAITLEPVAVVDNDSKHVAAPVATPLAAGAYTVAWRTLSKDGHPVSGEFGFTIKTR